MSYSVCNADLLMSERLTVQIDYCPKCRGIWLTNGKLDKLIEKPGPSPDSRERKSASVMMTMKAGSAGIFRGYLINPPRFRWISGNSIGFQSFQKISSLSNFQNSPEHRDVTIEKPSYME